jgi:NAD kinase
MTVENLLKVEGFREKTATKIHDGIKEKIGVASLVTIMSSSNIFGRGFSDKKLEIVMESYPNVLLSNESVSDKVKKISAIKGMATKTAEAFVEKIPNFIQFIKELLNRFRLYDFNLNEMFAALVLILAGKFVTEQRMMLEAVISRGKTNIGSGIVLNDVVINRGNLSRIIELETVVNKQYLTTYKADGLIISTPTGSTAYSLSAGGPIVFPGKNLIIINPICPHTLTNRPIIFPEDSSLHLTLWSKGKGATVTLDGQEAFSIKSGDVIIIKKSKDVTNLVLSPHRSYGEILRSKLGWGALPSVGRKK